MDQSTHFSPWNVEPVRQEVPRSLAQFENATGSNVLTRVSGPSKYPSPYRSYSIYANIEKKHKEAFQFVNKREGPLITTGGRTYPLSQAAYVVIDKGTGQIYQRLSLSPGSANSDVLLFERKKHSMRFGIIPINGPELTWEDNIIFMFIGLIERGECNPYVIFSAGVGGQNGFGGLVTGQDPNIVDTAIGAFSALVSLVQDVGDTDEAQKEIGAHDE